MTCHMTGKKVINEEVYNVYSSADIIKMIKLSKMRFVRHTAHIGEMRNWYKIFVGKPGWTRSLRRPRCRREVNNRMDLKSGCKVGSGFIWRRI